MKRLLTVLLTISILIIMPGTVMASPKVIFNGDKLSFDSPPVIENGRILVPLSTIFKALGATIYWDEDTQTVTAIKGINTIMLTIGDSTAIKNGISVDLDVPAKIINGRTFVPLGFVSVAMGCKIAWSNSTQTVVINDNSDPNSKNLVYSDPWGRFAIVYPNNWAIKTDVPNIDLMILPDPKESVLNDFGDDVVVLVQNIKDQNINMDLIKTKSLDYLKNNFTDVKVLSEKEVIISGNPGFERQVTFTKGKYKLFADEYFVYNNDFLYEITVNAVQDENKDLLAKLGLVANSIKIVDPYI
ncbi:MAG: stalk domain-containing protein [Syntrophomonas sp.]